MDSLTQAVLGGSLAAAFSPKEHRRKALLIGAALGTLPDLDVLIDYGDAVKNFTYHRGFSHSLFVLAPVSVFIWFILKLTWQPVQERPYRWLLAISSALLTHPILDAHTAYGTQLFWPLGIPPTMWSTIFIIDPLYTIPLLLGFIFTLFIPLRIISTRILFSGLFISMLYLGWTWVAQSIVKNEIKKELAVVGIKGNVVFATPTPLNSLLWRILVKTDNGFYEGFDSVILKDDSKQFSKIKSNNEILPEIDFLWPVNRLRWFSHDLVKVQILKERLVISDLRMGQEPTLVFNHIVAKKEKNEWVEISPELIPINYSDLISIELWHRIWGPKSSD